MFGMLNGVASASCCHATMMDDGRIEPTTVLVSNNVAANTTMEETVNVTTEQIGNSTTEQAVNITSEEAANTTTEHDSTEENKKLASYVGADAPVPTLCYKSAVSIWVNPVERVEYGIRQVGSKEAYKWQASNLFFGLSEHITYEIVTRYPATEQMMASEESAVLMVTTNNWTYSLRYHLNGGSGNSVNAVSYQKGQQDWTLASPQRKNNLFLGWYLESSCQNRITTMNCNMNANKHLYAKWKEINTDPITGVKIEKKAGNKLLCTFTERSDIQYYEAQYSTSKLFAEDETSSVKVNQNQLLTDTLTSGMTYYFRVRAVTIDSAGNKVCSDYSDVKSKKLKSSASGCVSDIKEGKTKVKVYKKKQQYLLVGEQIQLSVPEKTKTNKAALKCKSSKPKVAKVGAKGKVTAKKAGNAVITVTRGDVQYKYKIKSEEIVMNMDSADMVVGDKIQFTLSGTSGKVTYKTSDSKKATVKKDGTITAKGAGTVTITATYRGHQYSCKVTIITKEQHKINGVTDFYFSTIHKWAALSEGQFALEYQVVPANRMPYDIAWYSSNPAVAVVNNGVVTLTGLGTTEISVKYAGGTAKMKLEVVSASNTMAYTRIVCHRGGNEAPENSLAAFEKAAQAGYEYVETDIRWTKDNVPVLLHDATIDRTSNTTDNIKIADLTYEECMKLDFRSYFGEEYKDIRIVKFDDFLQLCRNYNLKAYIELKGVMYYEQASLLTKLVEYYQMQNQVSFISFEEDSLKTIAELMPYARLGYLSKNLSESVVNTAKQLKTGTNEVFLDVSYAKTITLNVLREVGNSGMDLEFYTIDDVETVKDAIRQGASGITTNCVRKEALMK